MMAKKLKELGNDEHEAALERRRIKMFEKQKYKHRYDEEDPIETPININKKKEIKNNDKR